MVCPGSVTWSSRRDTETAGPVSPSSSSPKSMPSPSISLGGMKSSSSSSSSTSSWTHRKLRMSLIRWDCLERRYILTTPNTAKRSQVSLPYQPALEPQQEAFDTPEWQGHWNHLLAVLPGIMDQGHVQPCDGHYLNRVFKQASNQLCEPFELTFGFFQDFVWNMDMFPRSTADDVSRRPPVHTGCMTFPFVGAWR